MTGNSSAILGTQAEKLINWMRYNPIDEFSRLESQFLLINLLSFIHAPHDLRFLMRTLNGLSEALFELDNRLNDYNVGILRSRGIDLSKLKQVVVHLCSHQEDLVREIGSGILLYNEVSDETPQHPIRGSFNCYHIYATFINSHESQNIDIRQDYSALQGYLFLAHSLLIVQCTSLQSYLLLPSKRDSSKRSIYSGLNAARVVRKYSEIEYDCRDILDVTNIKTLIKSMEKVGNIESDDKRQLARYLKKGFELNFIHQRQHKGKNKDKYRPSRTKKYSLIDGFVLYPSGQLHQKQIFDDSSAIIISSFEGDASRKSELIDLGLDPAENQGGEELLLIDNTDKKSGKLFTRAQVRHITMSNQIFRNQWAQATVHELTLLMKTCGEQIRSGGVSDLRREVISMVMIMLWTGSTLEEVRKNFRWLNGAKRYRKRIIGYKFDQASKTGSWVITPHTPNLKKIPTKYQTSYCRVKDDYLELPDPFNIGRYIVRAFSTERLSDVDNYLFNRKIVSYRKELSSFIKTIKSEHRLNESKISRYLLYKIASEGIGDIADSISITGRYHSLGQTLLHYASPSKEQLQGLYLDAIRDLVSKIYKEGYPCDMPKQIPGQIAGNSSVGSNLCPTVDAVKRLIAHLQLQISTTPEEDKNTSIIEYHNWYTLYTVLAIGYSTGYRAIVDPFPVDAEVDQDSGLAVISDKDGEDYYNSRIVWVPESVRKQITHYMAHRAKILPLIASRYPSIVLEAGNEKLSRIFLLEPDYKPSDIRPSTLSPLLGSHLPLPLNVNRRFLRTELRARGCPAEIVDAFMGHWSRGQEPWGQYSSLSIVDIVEELKVYIEAILVELKIEPIKSRFL